MSGYDPQPQKKALAFYQSGNDAAQKSNLDYAMQMYREAIRLDPSNVKYRHTLREVERKKLGNDPSKLGRVVAARLLPLRAGVKTAKARGQWSKVLESCEDAFAIHPWDVGAARDAADAAVELEYKELALWLLESVMAQANDADFFEQLAGAYELNNNFQKAIECMERVKKLNPRNETVQRKINALAASATIARSKIDEAINQRKAAAARPQEAALDEEAQRRAQLCPEQRLLQQIEDQPELVGPYLELSDIYRGENRLEEAERALARGLRAVPGDPTLLMTHADVQIVRLQQAREAWAKRSLDRPDDEEAKAKLEKIIEKQNDYEIKEYARRAALYPDDLSLQYELGLRYARAGQHREAIAAFQQARNDPAKRVDALHQAGLSFEAEGVLKLAERHYQDALKAADPADLPTVNTLHYRLGRVAESQGDNQTAIEHYNEVAANDYSYLDVAQRLRNLQ